MLLFYAYWRTFDREMIEAVRVGLERAVTTEPDYAEALACLSLVYSNAFRFRHPISASDPDPLDRALALAVRAVDTRAQLQLGALRPRRRPLVRRRRTRRPSRRWRRAAG